MTTQRKTPLPSLDSWQPIAAAARETLAKLSRALEAKAASGEQTKQVELQDPARMVERAEIETP